MDLQKGDSNEANALGGEDTSILTSLESTEPTKDQSTNVMPGGLPGDAQTPPPMRSNSLRQRIFGLITKVNIYLLLFILIVVIAGVAVYVVAQQSRKQDPQQTVDGNQALSNDTLNKLKNQDVKVGDAKQTLNVKANAIFAGKVLIRDSLDIAGQLKVGGSLSLAGLTVAGTTSVDQLQANGVSIGGNAAVQGQLTVQKGLTVAGGGSFSGALSAPQITVNSLQLNGDLQVKRHIATTGGAPGLSFGGALGGGGTASINGTDTAGTMTINTGSGPPAGCFATVTFTQKFGNTPHIAISPVGSAAGSINYYINRTNANFSICTASPPPAGQSFAFDYVALD